MALDMRVMLLGMERVPFLVPSSEFSQVPSHATINLLNMPLPPLSPGASTMGSRMLRTLLLLARGAGAGTSMMSGDLAPLRGTSTTMGCDVNGALVLGARLLLRARDSATDILFLRFLALSWCAFEKGSCCRGVDAAQVQGELERATSICVSFLRPRRGLVTGNAANPVVAYPRVDYPLCWCCVAGSLGLCPRMAFRIPLQRRRKDALRFVAIARLMGSG